MSVYQKWRPFDSEGLQASGFLWLAFLLFLAIYEGRYESLPGGYLFILVLIAVLAAVTVVFFAQWGKVTSKVYLVAPHIAEEVVINVLQNQALIYSLVEGGLEVGDNELFIGVRQMGVGHRRAVRGTLIKLRPTTPENEILIYALQHHLDEAFLPRGLTQR